MNTLLQNKSLEELAQAYFTDEAAQVNFTDTEKGRAQQRPTLLQDLDNSENDIQVWSCALENYDLTFDRWVFPETKLSNLRAISVTPFVNARGIVERYCHLLQQDGIMIAVTFLSFCCTRRPVLA
jgi:hypothetical protein